MPYLFRFLHRKGISANEWIKRSKWAGRDLKPRSRHVKASFLDNYGAHEFKSSPSHCYYYNNDNYSIDGGARWSNSDQAFSEVIIDWNRFHNFLLQRMTYKTAQDRLRYAKQFGKALETGNVFDLLNLQPDKRIHAMKALSNLAKFIGKYDVWLQLRLRYDLKWSTGTEKLDALSAFLMTTKHLI